MLVQLISRTSHPLARPKRLRRRSGNACLRGVASSEFYLVFDLDLSLWQDPMTPEKTNRTTSFVYKIWGSPKTKNPCKEPVASEKAKITVAGTKVGGGNLLKP